MGDMGDMYRDLREHKRQRRDQSELVGLARLDILKERGHTVQELSEHHFRVDGVVDFWPRSMKWREARPPHANGQGWQGLFRFCKEPTTP
jgi:hypothetical protein